MRVRRRDVTGAVTVNNGGTLAPGNAAATTMTGGTLRERRPFLQGDRVRRPGAGRGLIFISLRLRTGQIVCGRAGYHARHPDIPPCV
jgi:hypothetical protein